MQCGGDANVTYNVSVFRKAKRDLQEGFIEGKISTHMANYFKKTNFETSNTLYKSPRAGDA